MEQIFQVIGAMLILTAFVLAQVGRMTTTSRAYLVLNLVGAAILAVDAATHAQIGFLLLEGVWAVVAGLGLARNVLAAHRPGA